MDLKSLALMQCTGRSLRSHICNDPYFISEYFSRVESGFFHLSCWDPTSLVSYRFGDPKSLLINKDRLEIKSQILGSYSGLLLLYVDGLCVANPLTKRFRFLDHSTSELFPGIISDPKLETYRIGFAVDQVDLATQRFKIVCINLDESKMYRFEINAGDDSGWRLSKNTITCPSSDLMTEMKPVYFDGALHWLRKDGSIIAFNPETEEARLIPFKFSDKRRWETKLFTATDKELTLIMGTEEVIYVYALENILMDPKWVLVRRIENIVAEKKGMVNDWKVKAYDNKSLVLKEFKAAGNREVHSYDLRAKEWRVMGSIPNRCDANQDFFLFKPSLSSVIHLEDDKKVVACSNRKRFSSLMTINDNNKRVSSLMTIMRMIGGNSPYPLKARSC